jgi:hypothetical protein
MIAAALASGQLQGAMGPLTPAMSWRRPESASRQRRHGPRLGAGAGAGGSPGGATPRDGARHGGHDRLARRRLPRRASATWPPPSSPGGFAADRRRGASRRPDGSAQGGAKAMGDIAAQSGPMVTASTPSMPSARPASPSRAGNVAPPAVARRHRQSHEPPTTIRSSVRGKSRSRRKHSPPPSQQATGFDGQSAGETTAWCPQRPESGGD